MPIPVPLSLFIFPTINILLRIRFHSSQCQPVLLHVAPSSQAAMSAVDPALGATEIHLETHRRPAHDVGTGIRLVPFRYVEILYSTLSLAKDVYSYSGLKMPEQILQVQRESSVVAQHHGHQAIHLRHTLAMLQRLPNHMPFGRLVFSKQISLSPVIL